MTAERKLPGIHHISAIASDVTANLLFLVQQADDGPPLGVVETIGTKNDPFAINVPDQQAECRQFDTGDVGQDIVMHPHEFVQCREDLVAEVFFVNPEGPRVCNHHRVSGKAPVDVLQLA